MKLFPHKSATTAITPSHQLERLKPTFKLTRSKTARAWKFLSATILVTPVTGCGGHGAYTPPAKTSVSATATTYNFVTPKLNSQSNYTQTIIDNSNNTINETISDTVSSVNADGSFVVQQTDPNHNSVVVNGTIYLVQTETINKNNSGQNISYTQLGGSPTVCSYSAHGAGPNYPLAVGETWSSSWNITCGSNSPVSYMQTGSVVDVESITVPAGTYTAIKLQSTISWTDPKGTSHTESVTNWLDTNTMISVKEQTSVTYSGTIPTNGYPVLITKILQSQS